MHLFGALGLGSSALGLGIGGWLSLRKIWEGIIGGWDGFNAYQIGNRPLLLLAVLLIILAVPFLVMGLLAEPLVRTYYESQSQPVYQVKEIVTAQKTI